MFRSAFGFVVVSIHVVSAAILSIGSIGRGVPIERVDRAMASAEFRYTIVLWRCEGWSMEVAVTEKQIQEWVT